MRLGKHQLCLLATMASPFSLLIVPDKVALSLHKRGLLASRSQRFASGEEKDCLSVTPTGLRALADALERGDIEQFFDPKFTRDQVRLYLDGRKAEGRTP